MDKEKTQAQAQASTVSEEDAKEFIEIYENKKAPRGIKCKGRKGNSIISTLSSVGLAIIILISAIALSYSDYLRKHKAFNMHLAHLQGYCGSCPSLQQIYPYVTNPLYLCAAGAVLLVCWSLLRNKKKNVYLLEFTNFKDDSMVVSQEKFLSLIKQTGYFTEESLELQKKLVERGCVGNLSYWPPGQQQIPMKLGMDQGRWEANHIFKSILTDLFQSTGVKPKEIDILIVNCSLFCPTPSLTSMIVREFRMREDIQTFNLGGMGCSAGLISINLARDLLQVHKNSLCLVVSTEIISGNCYTGNDKSMLLQNVLFRCGGAAVLLSNNESDRKFSKYQLLHSIRTHRGADEDSFQSVYELEDEGGRRGVRLTRDLVQVAGKAIKANITTLAPLVLPISEKIKFAWVNIVQRKLLGKKVPAYVPDFKKAFDHFCIHAGGRGVLDGVQKSLSLTDENVKPSRASLYRFSNTSSSSIWYELLFLEKSERIKPGQKIWQIGFGSGFKCNSAVWESL